MSLSGPMPSHLGPSVRRLLQGSGIDPRSLTGSGPHGIITKGDVLVALSNLVGLTTNQKEEPPVDGIHLPTPQLSSSVTFTPAPVNFSASVPPLSFGRFEDISNTQIRKVIAKRLLESKTLIPHSYTQADVTLDPSLEARKVLKEQHGVSVSVNDFVVKAVAMALQQVPSANSFLDEKTGEIIQNTTVDISIAVATEKGLMTPIVRDANKKSLSAISSEIKSLAEKARLGKLKPDEFMGGTFSISNLGMFPVDRFNAIINPPQAGILAVGRGKKVVAWLEEEGGKGGPVTVTKMEIFLSGDSRVYNGQVAGEFLSAISSNLEDPKRLLL